MQDEATIQVYKCPTCNGALRFDAKRGSLFCLWCGNTYDTADIQAVKLRTTMQGYLCPECGARLMLEDYVAADTCPFCGNNEVAPARFEGSFEPDYVIPFSVTKHQVLQTYEEHVAKRRFLPNGFVRESRIISAQGTYVPFWLQSGTVDFDFTYVGMYKRDKMNYEARLNRVGTSDFVRVPADASDRMADDVMDSIEPYDYTEMVPYEAGYLPGFVAERYTVDSDEVDRRVNRRVANSACSAAMETIDDLYTTRYPDYDHFHATVSRSRIEQALLPVWLIVVSYGKEKLLVGVNGQTGKVAVNLPIHKRKQYAAALFEALKNVCWTLALYGSFVALIFAIAVNSRGFEGAVELFAYFTSGSFLADLQGENIIAFVSVLVFVGVAIVGAFVEAFRRGWKKVIQSMENVKTAVNADAYDAGSLHITSDGNDVEPQ